MYLGIEGDSPLLLPYWRMRNKLVDVAIEDVDKDRPLALSVLRERRQQNASKAGRKGTSHKNNLLVLIPRDTTIDNLYTRHGSVLLLE